MADNVAILCFLEDAAQEKLIPALLRRLIAEAGQPLEKFTISILYNRGGASLQAYKQFLEDYKNEVRPKADLLVVGSDANCKGFAVRRSWILKQINKYQWQNVIAAVPDPHIEHWYLLDLPALSRASGVKIAGGLPEQKCAKDAYKKQLRHAFANSGIEPPLGGAEYGEKLAELMDLYSAGKIDNSFKHFVDSFRDWLKNRMQ
jgi:hypothetical protein